MDWKKVVRKGLEAGLPAALGALGVSGEVKVVVTTAVVGFLFGGIKNWWKHRSRRQKYIET